ncbi:hypothetical protein IW140_004453 [Coemansia sp. RSA 1813]|nr:hypothetical protein LPJ74_003588 [Coemansia sp. RSA 1843]KAJ2087850.1 hypothetical protein IW138_004647 [Coemansia sp. RSA 986]KAJ2212742.1 hypothetical protein EV179_004395 [Coemansia sp. RSA 487]KAJ2567481.1 hypothetical protein IW140_004453 [Coemansia sp. RSA 1813]
MTIQTADIATAAANSSRNKAYLARSIAKCETQLSENEFSEPLDATQIRRLSTIEGIIAQYRQLACHDEDGNEDDLQSNGIAAEFGDRVEGIEHRVRPWVERKDALVASLRSAGQDEEEEETSNGVATSFVGTERDAPRVVPNTFGIPTDRDNNEHWTDGVSPSDLLAGPPDLLGEMEGLRRRGVVPNNADTVERLLQSQRDMHEDLTGDLVRMASALKKNTLDFGELMATDKKVMDETMEHLEKSAARVGKHGARLSKYRKRAWGTTGLTWLAVLVVVSVFFILVLFMRVAPKRY